jgi:rod shape determining protein RodA
LSPRTLLAALGSVLTLGWLAVWSSAGWANQGSQQLAHIGVGLLLLALTTRLRPAQLRVLAWPLYLVAAAALALVLLPGVGQTVNGSQRWLSLGPLGSWQPSEFAKLALILVLGSIYQGRTGEGVRLGAFLRAGLCTGLLFCLIAKQPDLGTALVLGAIFLGMSWAAGAPALPLFALVATAVSVAPFVLHEYQKNRLLIFLHPETDPRGLGYHITQAQLAIGSGGWVGQGLKQGPLSQNGFVPENWTDFVFSVIGEEFGLLGSWGLLLLGSIVAWQLLAATWQCKDRYDALVCSGICTLLGFQSLVNLSMNVGMAPVVGIPLPFCTYGGSAMIVNLAAVGLVMGSGLADRSAPKLKELLDRTASE